jgi:hypothetical protein
MSKLPHLLSVEAKTYCEKMIILIGCLVIVHVMVDLVLEVGAINSF